MIIDIDTAIYWADSGPTEFIGRLRRIEWVDGSVEVEYEIERGDAITTMPVFTIETYARPGDPIHTTTETNIASSPRTITVTIDDPAPGENVDVVFLDDRGADELPGALQLNGQIPDPPIDPEEVTVVSCDGTQEIVEGEEALVDVTIANGNFTDVSADVAVSVGPTTADTTAEIPAEGETEIQTAHTIEDEGEYDVTVSVSV